ncbi:MAG: LptF/LptG family permease [Planctomycetota bacterium]
MTAFMLLIGVAHKAVREGLGVEPILRLLPYILPDSMRFSIPAAALLAACTTYGRMSGENEVVAVKSLGISPWVLMLPTFIIGFLVSIFAVWINDLAVSWGREGMSRVVAESIEQIAYGMLRTQNAFSTDRFSISVKGVEGRKLILPAMTWQLSDGKIATAMAREAELVRNANNNSLKVLLIDGEGEGPSLQGAFREFEQIFPLGELRQKSAISASDIALRAIPNESVVQTQKIQRLEYGLAAQAASQLFSGDFEDLASPEWKQQEKRLRVERYRLNRLKTEPWRRWSNGFSCFFFVLIGAPWAIHRRNSDFVSNFFMVFLPIILIYYPLFAYGVNRAKEGAMPQYAVWMGNVACALIAGYLIKKVIRY